MLRIIQVKFAPQVYFFSRTVGALLVLIGVDNDVANIVCIGAVGFFASSVFTIIYSMALQARPEKANQISGLMITAVAGGGVVTPVIGFAIGTVGILGGVLHDLSFCQNVNPGYPGIAYPGKACNVYDISTIN